MRSGAVRRTELTTPTQVLEVQDNKIARSQDKSRTAIGRPGHTIKTYFPSRRSCISRVFSFAHLHNAD